MDANEPWIKPYGKNWWGVSVSLEENLGSLVKGGSCDFLNNFIYDTEESSNKTLFYDVERGGCNSVVYTWPK